MPAPNLFTRWITVLYLVVAPFALDANESALPTIEISGLAPQPQNRDRGILKLPGDRRSLPLSIERVEHDIIDVSSRGALSDVLDFATSAVTVSSEGGSMTDVFLRGFGNTPYYRNGLNDSLGQLAPRSLRNIDHIEILKGPNSALFGPGEPGGAINLVTKRPLSESRLEAAAGFAHFSQSDFDFDATGALPSHRDWQYRVIGAREQGDTFRDFVKQDRWFFAPSLAWQPTARTDVVASVEYLRDQRPLDAGIFVAADRPRPDRTTFLGEPGVGAAINDGLTAQFDARFLLAHDWEIEVQAQTQRTRLKGTSVEPAELVGSSLLREVLARNEQVDSWIAQFEIYGPLELWRTGHELLLGLEATGVDEDVQLFNSDTDSDPFAIDPWRPVYGAPLPALEPERLSHEHRRQVSVYLRDRITLDTHWRVLIGARLDNIEQSGNDVVLGQGFGRTNLELSPRLSLVYDTGHGLIGYASYSQSVDPNEGLQPDGTSLKPTLGKSVEAGLRWTSAEQRVALDVAAFGIRQSDVTVDAPGRPGFELQTAEQEHIGVDLEIEIKPVPALSLRARYNWLDTRITNDPFVPDGTAALNTPQHQAGLLALWRGAIVRAGDLELGLALNYLGRRPASLDPRELELELPGYVRADVFARWHLWRHLDVGLRLENLTDEDYIQGSQSDAFSLSPGAPFSARGEIRLRFD